MRALEETNLFVIVSYDITKDSKRTKMHKVLSQYGQAVQYSVFECLLRSKESYKRMKKEIKQVKIDEDDSVRLYIIGPECLRKREAMGVDRSASNPHAVVA